MRKAVCGDVLGLLRLAVGVGLLFIVSAAQAAGHGQYQVVEFERDLVGDHLARSTWTVQQGSSELNQFRVVRLYKTSHGGGCRAPVMLVSPFGFPVEFWQIPDGPDPESGFAQQVALSGHEVWLVESRIADVAPGQCESGAVDCSVMQHWGVQTAVSDALYARFLLRLEKPSARPVIGGFSGGSSTALAAINSRPSQFAGLFLWEGTLLSADPLVQARNAQFCDADLGAMAQGIYYDSSVQGFKTLFDLATAAPADPTPIPDFPPGTTNLGVLLFALTQADASNPLNFTEAFVRFVGDPVAETLTYSDLDRALALGPLVGNYAPIAFIRDTHCSLSGQDTRFVNRLDRFKGSALVLAEGQGFGPLMLDTAAALTRADVSVDYEPDYGESDGYFNVNWQSRALDPLLDWLDAL